MVIMLKKNERIMPVQDYPLYYVSNFGRVYSTIKRRFLKPMLGSTVPYYTVVLTKYENGDPLPKRKRIHTLVAQAFIKNPLNKPQVNHKDRNKLNNLSTNLEWATCAENIQHYLSAVGENHGRIGKRDWLTKEDIIEMKRLCRKGFNQTRVAMLFNCHRTHVCNVMAFRKWKTVL